jgi:predicted regulator of Ras-like GTPase activity (Roadblock/LC7/MglB family)
MSKDSVSRAAGRALEELLEVSPQVDAAVILERDGGRLLASAPASSDRVADRLATTCVKIVDAAEQARRELGREPVSQVEVATPDGHVFVVADATWIVAAVTDADPTVGLVFYDLKTSLRTVREARPARDDAPAASTNGAAKVTVVATEERSSDATTSSGDDSSATTSPGDDDGTATASGDARSQQQRWRRRKS